MIKVLITVKGVLGVGKTLAIRDMINGLMKHFNVHEDLGIVTDGEEYQELTIFGKNEIHQRCTYCHAYVDECQCGGGIP